MSHRPPERMRAVRSRHVERLQRHRDERVVPEQADQIDQPLAPERSLGIGVGTVRQRPVLVQLAGDGKVLPFVLTMALFLLSFLGLGISLWPNVIPPDISIWEAAAPPETQIFVLIGTLILLPVVLGYTAFTYYVFRGKVRAGEGYH